MGCGSSSPDVKGGGEPNVRKKAGKMKNVKIEITEDPEKQGEKFHMTDNEDESNESEDNNNIKDNKGNKDNNDKDSFDDF